MRIALLGLALAALAAGTTGAKPNVLPQPAADVQPMLVASAVFALPLSRLEETTYCVHCFWVGACDFNQHIAEYQTAGPPDPDFQYLAPHEDCRDNGANYMCQGHPLCDHGALVQDDSIIRSLADRSLDGDAGSLAELAMRFPRHLRLNSEWNMIEILGCPSTGAILGTVPVEEAPEAASLLSE